MSETTQAEAVSNPFDPEQFAHGGGLWDGKTVTITKARAKTEPMLYKDGTPVLNEKTKLPSVPTTLELTGIADGGDDKERREEYSAGDKLVATPDGEGFVPKDGGPLTFHANSNIAKLSAALKTAGFDIGTLLARDAAGNIIMLAPGVPKQQFSKLIGARFVFKGEAKLGKDGKPIKDKKGYDKNVFYPVKFVGYAGAAATGVTPKGNGGVGVAAGSGLDAKATEQVLVALAAKGGSLSRADMMRTLSQQLAGDPDLNGIIALVLKDGFHAGKAWKFDGKVATL